MLEIITEMIRRLSILAAMVELTEYTEKSKEYTVIAEAPNARLLWVAGTLEKGKN